MKFYVKSVLFDGYNYVESVLKAYPKITNCNVEEVEGVYRPCKMLAVGLKTAEDIIRFIDETKHEIFVRGTLTKESIKQKLLIYDDYME